MDVVHRLFFVEKKTVVDKSFPHDPYKGLSDVIPPFLIGVYRLNVTLRHHDASMILSSTVQLEYRASICVVPWTIVLDKGEETWVSLMCCIMCCVSIGNVCI